MFMKETQQQIEKRKEAIAFAEWLSANTYDTGNGTFLEKDGKKYTFEQLYSILKESKQ